MNPREAKGHGASVVGPNGGSSTGLAAGRSTEEAIDRAIYEVLERDAFMRAWRIETFRSSGSTRKAWRVWACDSPECPAITVCV